MKTSDKGLEALADYEGNKLYSYLDTGGVWTIGVGHTSDEHFKVEKGQTISHEKSMELLAIDVKEAEDAVNKLVKVALTQNQFDALVSFVFNLGENAFRKSTLLRLLNGGDYTAAAGQFKRWNMDNGVVVNGLTNRRKHEAAVFMEA